MKNAYRISDDGTYAIVELTQGQATLVDIEDLDKIGEYRWCAAWSPNSSKYYASTEIRDVTGKRKTTSMQRFLTNPPSHLVVDHVDGDSLNNRKINLRICTHAQNLMNRGTPKNNTSGHKGVYFRDRKYKARIAKDNINYHIGSYNSYEEAVAAHEAAIKEIHGTFSRLSEVVIMEKQKIQKIKREPIEDMIEGYGKIYKIPLTRGQFAIIDFCDIALVKDINWYSLYNKGTNSFYAHTRRVNMLMHRLIMKAKPGDIVDHINGITLDNRRCNLRVCTQSENNKNMKLMITNTSGYKGVSSYDSRWRAYINVNGKNIHLGYFNTKEEAHDAYCVAAIKYHGIFARFS